MRANRILNPDLFTTIRASLILLFLLFSTTLMSQSQINFSGAWTYNKAKSTPGTYISEYPGTITREITQTPSTFTYHDIYTQDGTNSFKKSDTVLNLDGKEEIDKSDPDVTLTKSLKWLKPIKSFIITFKTIYIDEGVSKEILINSTYTLSDDGKTLTIDEYHKAELGETKTIDVYHKK